MAIQEFNPVFRPVVNPVDLDKLGRAYDTLEQGHQQAVATASAVEGELAKLDLNESEDAWRQEQVNKVRSAITDNSQYGNAYGALDDVIRTNGSIMSNPGMIGRLRAQQDYKQYVDRLEKRGDIPEDYKAYYKEMNKYNYKDITDDKGNIIGGSKWQPTDQEVSTVPMNQILSQALQWAAKESGGGSQTRWLDASGRPTDDITKSVTGEFYSSSSNRWERLSKDKLAAAVSAVIENTPGAKASLEQDYKIAKWKYDKSGGENPDITDKDGILLTPEQYLNKRIDPFYKAATYYNQTSDTKYGEAWKAQLALARTAASANQGQKLSGTDILTTTTNPVRVDNFVPIQAQSAITMSKQKLADIIKTSNPNLDFNLDNQTNESIKKLITDNVKDPNQLVDAMVNLEVIQDKQEYLNKLKIGSDPDVAAGFDTYNAIVSMSDLPQDNKYAKEYSKAVNNIFGNGQAIRQYFTSDDSYDGFIKAIGGEKAAAAMGIRFSSKDGKKYAELPRDYNRALYSFAKASRQSISQNTNIFGAVWNSLKGTVNQDWGNNVAQVMSDGSESPVLGRTVQDGIISGLPASQSKNVFGDVVDYVDNRLKGKNNDLLKGGKLQLGQNVITEPTPNAAELVFGLQSGTIKSSDFNAQYKIANDQAMKAISNIDLTQTGALVVGKNGMFEEVDSKERQILTARIRSAKPNDIEVVAVQDPQTGQWSPQITLKGSYEGDKEKYAPVTLYAPGGFDSSIVESWNRDTTFRAMNDVNVNSAAGLNVNLTNAAAFANIDKISMEPVGGGFQVIDKTNNKSLGVLSNDAAVSLRDIYYQWNDMYNMVTSSMRVPEERIKNTALKAATMLSNVTGGGNNEEVIAYYYQQLINNITGQ